ncbi:MAG: LrgB family protein [Rikenellaceae bacterium]
MEKITTFFSSAADSEVFLITLTVLVYYTSIIIRDRYKWRLLNPVLVSSLFIIFFINIAGIEYQKYSNANQPINFMLGISVVCLGYLMNENFANIKEFKTSIILSTIAGSIVGILGVIGMTHLFGLEEFISLSLQTKSVTTPIALSLSESIGGIPALTALAVSGTGIFGSVVGPSILRLFGIRDAVATGAALGSCAHAIGTARALEIGALEGAVGGAAIGLMGLFTSFLIPIIHSIL